MTDFLDYYEKELTFLREMGCEFGRKYPKVAGRLQLEPDKCEDPHTERLIEAFAFLSARILQKLDEDLPEITQSLLQILYPHVITPIPSMSVVRFAPLLKNVPDTGYVIERGTPLFSKPVGGIPCQFATSCPVTLWPLEVVGAGVEEPLRSVKGAQHAVRISLKLHNKLNFCRFPGESLRFYLNGQPQHVFPLYELLLNNLCHIECLSSAKSKPVAVALPKESLRAAGFSDSEMLLHYPLQSFQGYRLLLEYFSFPQKFLFFDLVGLSSLSTEVFGDSLDLLLYLDRPVKQPLSVDANTFCLYATPVINAFSKIAEPIRVEHRKPEYRVVPDLRRVDCTEVLSVDEVTATLSSTPLKVKKYRPLYSVEHHRQDAVDISVEPLWHSQRRPSSLSGNSRTEVFLSFCNFDLQEIEPEEETVMVRVTCSNHDLPGKLSFGDTVGDFDLQTAAPVESIKCLHKPTGTLRPPLGGEQQWRLISHLSLNHMSLVERGEGALKEILALCDPQDSPVTRQQISGVLSVRSRHVTRRIGFGFCRGVEVAVVFDEEMYVGSGLFLFASVIERFLGQYVSVNSFVQFVAMNQKEEVLKQWPPRNGDRVLL